MENYIENNQEEIIALGESLFNHPQLGYKEFINKNTLKEYFEKHGLKIENECFETAFSVSIGHGYPHIGLVAELDALPTLGHPCANKDDNNAAHSCGHSTQCAIQAAALVALSKKEFKGKVTLFFTPAEEYTDIPYRNSLIQQGKIKYIGGKQNMLAAGMFDDCDCLIHLHTMSTPGYHYCLNTRQGGFIYKKLTFLGKAAHAAIMPQLGVNALNAYVLFQNAVNMLRETFKEEDCIRVHGIVDEGGQTVNSIPERVIYECYVRSFSLEAMQDVSKKLDNAAICCANALGANCEIESVPGYIPLVQSDYLNKVALRHMLENYPKEVIELDSSSMAAGDLGDLSTMKPVIQLGYSGFKGVPHSKDLEVINPKQVYIETSRLIEDIVTDLLENPSEVDKIKAEFKPRMTMKEYLEYLDNK